MGWPKEGETQLQHPHTSYFELKEIEKENLLVNTIFFHGDITHSLFLSLFWGSQMDGGEETKRGLGWREQGEGLLINLRKKVWCVVGEGSGAKPCFLFAHLI